MGADARYISVVYGGGGLFVQKYPAEAQCPNLTLAVRLKAHPAN